MKSLLVDALRRANTGDTGPSVSDSGSFDTADSEFGATANDEVIDSHELDAEELELLSSTGVLVVSDDAAHSLTIPSAEFSPEEKSGAQLSISGERYAHVAPPGNVPVLARYAPLICIVLAIVAAGSWLLYRQVEIRYFHGAFDSSHFQTSVNADGASNLSPVVDPIVERFPYIDVSTEGSDAAGATP